MNISNASRVPSKVSHFFQPTVSRIHVASVLARSTIPIIKY